MMSWFKRKKKEEFVGEVHKVYGQRPGLNPNQTVAEYEFEKRMQDKDKVRYRMGTAFNSYGCFIKDVS